MTVANIHPVNTAPPPAGQLWDPDAMAAVVFPGPLNKRSLVYDAMTVDNMWEAAVSEVRTLRGLIDQYSTERQAWQLEGGQDMVRAAAQQAQQIRDQAQSEAVQIVRMAREQAAREVGTAHLKAQQLQAEALERIAAAEHATAGPAELAELPGYTQNIADTLTRRTETAMDNVRTVLAEAEALETAAARARMTLTPMLAPAPAVPAAADATTTWAAAYAPGDRGPTLVDAWNAAGERIGPSGMAWPSGIPDTTDASALTPPGLPQRPPAPGRPRDDKGRFVPRSYRDPGPNAVTIMHTYPEHGLTKGDLVDADEVPAGVVFSGRPHVEPPPEYSRSANFTPAPPEWSADVDDRVPDDQTAADLLAGDPPSTEQEERDWQAADESHEAAEAHEDADLAPDEEDWERLDAEDEHDAEDDAGPDFDDVSRPRETEPDHEDHDR
jgi:hypothetical protein